MSLSKELLADIPLFNEITEDELVRLDKILSPRIKEYRPGEFLSHPEDILEEIVIVLQGKVHMISEDFWGNQNIIAEFTDHSLFGEAHSISRSPMFFSLAVVKPSTLLSFYAQKLQQPDFQNDSALKKLHSNLMNIIIEKKLDYMRKADILSRRNLREKISAFLSEEYRKKGTSSFHIPYNRQQMADYLSTDRSALSKELSRMKQEGILDYNHNCCIMRL